MKKEGSLKIILSVLVIVLLCLVSLGGVYVKYQNTMKNKLPEYSLGMELKDTSIIRLKVKKDVEDSSINTEETQPTEITENTENTEVTEATEVTDSTENAEGTEVTENPETTTEQPATEEKKEDIYTEENYKKAKKIIENRLKAVEIEQYTVRLDSNTGDMVIEVPTEKLGTVYQDAFKPGKVEIKIADTDEVIATNKNIKDVDTKINSKYRSSYGSYVEITIKFDREAVNKFKDIKNTNETTTTSEDGNIEDRNITINVDGSAICTLKMSEFLASTVEGSIPLTIGSYTIDDKVLDQYLTQANLTKALLINDEIPVEFEKTYVEDVHSNISSTSIVIVLSIIAIAMAAYLIVKFKLKGVYGALSIVGLISALLLIVRYANIIVTISSIVAIAAIMFIQFLFLIKVLNNKNTSKKIFNANIIDLTKMLIPAFIVSLIISFAKIVELSGFGQVIFWGILLFELFNNILTRAMLINVKNK